MLRSERDVVETLAGRAVTVEELYQACVDAGVASRDDGFDVIHGANDLRFKRRVRNSLQALKRSGRARRVGEGTWLIDGTRAEPRRALLILSPAELGVIELALADAAELLDELADADVAADLILADPPWALDRQGPTDVTRRIYARDPERVVGGYVDVDPGAYREFTHRWVEAAAGLLNGRPGSQLAVITGPQQAARVQTCAEDAGLTYVNQVVARKVFPVRTTRRFSHAHTVVTILCSGPLQSSQRFFSVPAELPKAASGVDYPLDWWDARGPEIPWGIAKFERRGALSYDNALPPDLVSRIIRALTPGADNGGENWQSLVVDPFCGSGTTPLVCRELRRRCIAGDRNQQSLRFTMARMAGEEPPQLLAVS